MSVTVTVIDWDDTKIAGQFRFAEVPRIGETVVVWRHTDEKREPVYRLVVDVGHHAQNEPWSPTPGAMIYTRAKQ